MCRYRRARDVISGLEHDKLNYHIYTDRKGEIMKKSRLQQMSDIEIKWFCLQYNDKLRYTKAYPDSELSRRYIQDINMIETALHIVTDSATYEPLKKHITNKNMPYERLGAVPMGRRQFYAMRRKFFETLQRLRYDS